MFIASKSLIFVLLLATSPYRLEDDSSDPAIKEFSERAKSYWDLHGKAAKDAPPIDKKKESDPKAIVEHQQQLAAIIQESRKTAKEGDIFSPAAKKILVAIRQELASGTGAKAREMILGEGNPKSPESKARVNVVVNAKYPPTAPLSTVPPSVLLKLPKLPHGLEYRFVGRDLLLYDSEANLIVDILRNAVR